MNGTDAGSGSDSGSFGMDGSVVTTQDGSVITTNDSSLGGDAAADLDAGPPIDFGMIVGDQCGAGAPTLPTGTPVHETLVGYAGNYAFTSAGACQSGSFTTTASVDRAYAVSIPAGQRLLVNTTSPSIDIVLNLVSGTDASACTALSCVAGADQTGQEEPESLSYTNSSGTTFNGFLVVTSYGDTTGGDFYITSTVGVPPQGDDCGSAIALSSTPVTGASLANFSSDFSFSNAGAVCSFASGPDAVYRVTVPAGALGYITATPLSTSSLDLTVSIVAATSGCVTAPGTFPCVSATDGMGGGQPESVEWQNTGVAAADYFVIVDSLGSSAPGDTYGLTFTTAAAATTGNLCSTATPLTAAIANQTFAGYGDTYGNSTMATSCNFSSRPDRVFSVSVPAGQRFTLSEIQTSDMSPLPLVNLVAPISSCGTDMVTCTGSTPSLLSDGTTYGVGWSNGGSSAATVGVIVSPAGAIADTFSITPSFSPISAGDVCASATALTAPSSATYGISGFYNDYSSGSGCAGLYGIDRVFSVVVPAHHVLTATTAGVAPDAGATGLDPSINLVAGPASACDVGSLTCVASDDAGGATDVNTVMYTNTTSADVTMFIVIGTTNSSLSEGSFTLTTAIAAM